MKYALPGAELNYRIDIKDFFFIETNKKATYQH